MNRSHARLSDISITPVLFESFGRPILRVGSADPGPREPSPLLTSLAGSPKTSRLPPKPSDVNFRRLDTMIVVLVSCRSPVNCPRAPALFSGTIRQLIRQNCSIRIHDDAKISRRRRGAGIQWSMLRRARALPWSLMMRSSTEVSKTAYAGTTATL